MLKAGQTWQVLGSIFREVLLVFKIFFFTNGVRLRQKDLVQQLLNKNAIHVLQSHQVHAAFNVGMVDMDGQTFLESRILGS